MRKNLGVLFPVFVFVAAGAMTASTAKADVPPLVNNGNNLIYDLNLNITWYDPVPTYMSRYQATAWASGLTVGGTTAGSWTLPTTLPVNGSTYSNNAAPLTQGHAGCSAWERKRAACAGEV